MASSGTSSFPWRWDVFLSFRGEDTRFNFTDHLYSALRRNGIHTFRDDPGLERGGEIEPSLLKAIEESRISIVIFSENYAHSKWCLDEIDKIMQSRREKGQIVVPVFYHVDPSDVRKQTASFFAEAFARYGKVTDERLLRWRAALTEAGSLSGWHVQHGYESEIIDQITQYILHKLNRRQLHISEHLVGMDSRLEEMTPLLCMAANDVRMIGIHGIGGIGKTTIAKLVYNEIADQFEHVSFLSCVSQAKDSHRLLQLQKQLLADIVGENIPRISNIEQGINVIKHRFFYKKVLIVLDDVNDLTQLDSFVGNHQWFGPGSRIIITTRDKHLLYAHGVDQFYEMKGLKLEEAFELFSWKAFQANFPREGFVNFSVDVVNYCAGLPLALEVLGSFLRGKAELEWESELQKLQREPKMRIHDVLKLSLEGLDRSEKDLFLNIACFFNGWDVNSVGKLLDSCNFFPTGMRVLNDRSLIHISDNKIRMHDLVQQMGRQIVQGECLAQPGRRSRLWDSEDVLDVLMQNTGTEAIEGISFDLSASKEMQLTTEAFENMKGLRFLRIYLDGLVSYDANTVHLPQDFKFPSAELRYLCWDGWSLESLPPDFNGEKLVELSLKHSSIKQLWNWQKHLKRLKAMNLSHSRYLVECPDLSGSPYLETLNLEGCTSLHELDPSIPSLKDLKTLNLAGCTMLHYFPSITGLESLEVLNLSGCSRIDKFPDILANMGCLFELNLEATAIRELPSSVRYLQGLDVLNMQNCKNLNNLPGSICALKSLRTLILSGCSKLERFPEITEDMEHLEKLLLDGTSIRDLPCSILHLKGLLLLNLRKCKNLGSLPDSICGLKSLETLIVSGCSKLKKLPEDLGRLQCLRNLQAGGTAITQPPTSLVYLTNLEELSFSGCKGSASNFWILSPIFRLLHRENSDGIGLQLPSLSGLRFLKDLDLSYCNLREGMIDNMLCHLDSLEVLNLSRNHIASIPTDISKLSNLRVLFVRQCQQLQKIPEFPPSIKLLDACDCTSLKSLPPSPIIKQCLPLTLLGPVRFMLWNCSRLPQDCVAMALEKLHQNLFPEIGYSIVIPGNRIPKWPWDENIGASVSADLPPHGLDNNFLGIVLCAVFALEEDEIIKRPGQIYCEFECREGPYYRNCISWTHGGDRVVETDHVWMIYEPRAQFVKSKSSSANVFQRIKASFTLYGASYEVKKCAIRLIHAPNTSGNNMEIFPSASRNGSRRLLSN